MSAIILSSFPSKCLIGLFLVFNVKASGELKFEMISFVTKQTAALMEQSHYHFQINISTPGTKKSKTSTYMYIRDYHGGPRNLTFNQNVKGRKRDEMIWRFETLPSELNISVEVRIIDKKNGSLWATAFETYQWEIEINEQKILSADNGKTELRFRVTTRCDLAFFGMNCDRFCNESLTYTCSSTGEKLCKAGWADPLSDCEEDDNECLSLQMPCDVGWDCENTHGNYICKCPKGFAGKHCEVAVKPCDSSPCRNGNCTNDLDEYSCTCNAGYSGTNCEFDHNQCRWMPCGERGNCTNVGTDYVCDCVEGLTGKNCREDINECITVTHEESLCRNNGTCINTNGGYYCLCQIPFKGETCLLLDNDYEIYSRRTFLLSPVSIIGFLAFLVTIFLTCLVLCLRKLLMARRQEVNANPGSPGSRDQKNAEPKLVRIDSTDELGYLKMLKRSETTMIAEKRSRE